MMILPTTYGAVVSQLAVGACGMGALSRRAANAVELRRRYFIRRRFGSLTIGSYL